MDGNPACYDERSYHVSVDLYLQTSTHAHASKYYNFAYTLVHVICVCDLCVNVWVGMGVGVGARACMRAYVRACGQVGRCARMGGRARVALCVSYIVVDTDILVHTCTYARMYANPPVRRRIHAYMHHVDGLER